jgi:hypothetical protein
VTADDVRDAVAAAVGTLGAARDRDRSVPAGGLTWGRWETVEHVADVARGLGLAWQPDDELCTRVLARLMPAAGIGELAAWHVLRGATGRTELPGRPRRERRRWYDEARAATAQSGGCGSAAAGATARSMIRSIRSG